MLDGFRHQVERAHLVPRLGEVRRHPPAHVPQSDECDLRHLTPRTPAKAGAQSSTKKRRDASPGPRLSPWNNLPSLPIPWPLVDEGGHAFLLVLCPEQSVEQAALEADALRQRDLEGGVDHLLDRD